MGSPHPLIVFHVVPLQDDADELDDEKNEPGQESELQESSSAASAVGGF